LGVGRIESLFLATAVRFDYDQQGSSTILKGRGVNMSTNAAPKYVTVASWIMIVLGAFGVVGILNSYRMIASGEYDRMMNDPKLPAWVKNAPKPRTSDLLVGCVTSTIQIVAGVMMLKGRGIGRVIYLGTVVLGVVSGLISGAPLWLLLPGLIIPIILLFMMFGPNANAYFRGDGSPPREGI